MAKYNFYMQQCTSDGVLISGTKRDLEADFVGLKYSKCEGLNNYGSAKNIYTETYADAKKDRVYVPKEIARESTTIKFTFYIFGSAEQRQRTLDEFMNYLDSGQYFYYWDSARKRRFMFTPPSEEVVPSDELWYAGNPYFKIELNLKNLYGFTESIE